MNIGTMRATSASHGSPAGPNEMPWGKHKGKPISQVPADYLRWVLKNADNATPDLLDRIEKSLEDRGAGQALLASTEGDPGERERARLTRELNLTSRKVSELQGLVKKHERDESILRDKIAQLQSELARATAAKQEAVFRSAASPKAGEDVESLRRIVKRWYGAISRRYHPDLGGTTEQQIVANGCYQEFMKLLEGVK